MKQPVAAITLLALVTVVVPGSVAGEKQAASATLLGEWTLHCERFAGVHPAFNLGAFTTGEACEDAHTHLLEVDGQTAGRGLTRALAVGTRKRRAWFGVTRTTDG